MFFGTDFNCEWPPKALQDLFTDARAILDPEFKAFDLKSLRTKGPDEDRDEEDTEADQAGKRLKQ
jgi:hypothetical protein